MRRRRSKGTGLSNGNLDQAYGHHATASASLETEAMDHCSGDHDVEDDLGNKSIVV